jgi:IQ calmodulin-binding motif
MQNRAQRASAAMAFAEIAKEKDDAVIILQKYVRRWLARRRFRELKFELMFQRHANELDSGVQQTAISASADVSAGTCEVSTTGRYHTRTQPRSASWHFAPDRQPLMAIEMKRKADRRLQLRNAYRERKENQKHNPKVAAPLTAQQELKVARRNFPLSRQSTPISDIELPQQLPMCDLSRTPVDSPDAGTHNPQAQLAGANTSTVSLYLKPPNPPKTGARKVPVQARPLADRMWTPGTACKDVDNWLGVLNHECAYNKLQRTLTRAKSEVPVQRMPRKL